MSTSDEARLELDDGGQVVGASGGGDPAAVVDLADPEATVAMAATQADAVLATHVSPWLRRHRAPVASVAIAATLTALVGAWWTHRPPYVAPPIPIVIEDAVLDGYDLGGPSIAADGRLSVAYSVRSTDPATRFAVLDVAGPGLAPLGVSPSESAPSALASTSPVRVQAESVIQCSDPQVGSAIRGSYGLDVRRVDADGTTTRLRLPFGPDVSDLSVAVHDHCLTSYVVPALSIVESTIVGSAGSSVASLMLVVRNSSNLPATVSTLRGHFGDVDIDLSPDVVIAPQRSAVVSSRLMVQDCGDGPRPASLLDLANPVVGAGYAKPGATSGLTLRVSSAGSAALASYSLSKDLGELGSTLRQVACRSAPSVRATLADVAGSATIDGGWKVSGTITVLTSGVGISVGREQFDGPAWGAGSVLAASDATGTTWTLAPARLDGGDGYLPLQFTGSNCADGLAQVPHSIPVRIMTAERVVYPFDVAVDPSTLGRALASVCPSS